jgi:protein NrfD
MQGQASIPTSRTLAISWRRPPVSLLLIAWFVVLAVGLVGVVIRLQTGHQLVAYTSAVPWGLWVAAYAFLVGISSGSFLLGAVIYVFRIRQLEGVAKLALLTAIAALNGGLFAIWLDLGHEWRFYRVFTSPNPVSMMAWMVWLYTAYAVLATLAVWLVMRSDLVSWARQSDLRGRIANVLLGRIPDAIAGRALAKHPAMDAEANMRLLRLVSTVRLPLTIAASGGVGALFGVVAAREFWNSPIYPLLFIVGGWMAGASLVTAGVAFLWPRRGTREHLDLVHLLSRICLALLAVYLVVFWAQFSILFYSGTPAQIQPMREVLGGSYLWVFWVFQLGLGALVPLLVFALRPRSAMLVGGACLLVATGFLAVLLNIIVPGFVQPQLTGLERAFFDPRLSYQYFPSLLEWAVFAFVLALASGIYFAGLRLLPIFPKSQESHDE